MTALAIELLLKSSVLIACAAALDFCLRQRGSAATRHLVWTLTVIALALLPALLLTMPRWNVRVPIEQSRIDPAGLRGRQSIGMRSATTGRCRRARRR